MREDLQKQLYDKYPEIFRQKDLPMNQTAMCWGITVGNGWYNIITVLCDEIKYHIENENLNRKYKKERGELPQDAPDFPQIEAVQVKEKFGGLRFYVNYYDEYIRGVISMAEAMSLRICEYCGNPGKPNEDGYWITTLCEPCKKEEMERLRKREEEMKAAIEARNNLTVQMKDVTVAP